MDELNDFGEIAREYANKFIDYLPTTYRSNSTFNCRSLGN